MPALFTVNGWSSAGKNPGGTKNQEALQKFDEVIEVACTDSEKRLIPGVDFLAAEAAISLVLAGLTFLRVFRRKRKTIS